MTKKQLFRKIKSYRDSLIRSTKDMELIFPKIVSIAGKL